MASRIVSVCLPLCADCCDILVPSLKTEKYRGRRQKRKMFVKASIDGCRASRSEG